MNTSLAAAKRLAATAAVLAAIGASPNAHALALGNINVLSGLNQPLRAVVPLIFEEGETAENLDLNIAGDADAVRLGALPNLLGQEVGVVISLQGDRTEALITTEFPVKEPHLDVVLRASLGETNHLRVYPVLLDLPSSFFEPGPDDSYLDTEIRTREIWDGTPSEHQREQMNQPTAVDSLDVEGESTKPIAVGSLPPTGYDDPYEETMTFSVDAEDAIDVKNDITGLETAATDVQPTARDIGSVLPEAIDTSTFADVEVSDDMGATLPTAGIDEAMYDPSLAPVETTASAATEQEALGDGEEELQFPRVTPALPESALEAVAVKPEPAPAPQKPVTPAPQLDLASWAGIDAQLPLPEDVLLAEVSDEIGAPIGGEVRRADALTGSRFDRPGD